MYNVHCTMYTAQCTCTWYKYNIFCKVQYTVHCTVYSVYSTIFKTIRYDCKSLPTFKINIYIGIKKDCPL